MIISISEAAKRFNVSRSKMYRMKDSGQISFNKRADGTTGIDLSEMIRVFGENSPKQQSEKQNDTNQTNQRNTDHDLATENFYLKREIYALAQSLQKSEARVDQLLNTNSEQTKQFLLMHSKHDNKLDHNLNDKLSDKQDGYDSQSVKALSDKNKSFWHRLWQK